MFEFDLEANRKYIAEAINVKAVMAANA